jgi:hypothetical protein
MVERFNRTLKTMLRKYAAEFNTQWDRYLSGALWAYRNLPHDSTGEKPSFLLYGVDCRTPTEAALLPAHTIEPTEVSDYLEEMVLSLSAARRLAAEAIQAAQTKYKASYDRHSRDMDYQIRDWVLVRFPKDETGRLRKLSRPWHGPYHVVDKRDPDITIVKLYAPQGGQIQVHQSRYTNPGVPLNYQQDSTGMVVAVPAQVALAQVALPDGLTSYYKEHPLPQFTGRRAPLVQNLEASSILAAQKRTILNQTTRTEKSSRT